MIAADLIFKTIIVHEDSITGLLAINLLTRLAAQLNGLLRADIEPWDICNRIWQFKWLKSPEVWAEAVSLSSKADLIIISAEDHTELPPSVRSWIESVLPRKQNRPAFLLALLDGQEIARMSSRPPARYLRQLAGRYGVDFVCNLDDQPARVQSGMEKALSRLTGTSGTFSANPGNEISWASMTSPLPTTHYPAVN